MQPLERLRRARRVGVLFSGGAARCVFQVGVVEALFGLGIEPDVYLGVSGGACNAAVAAVGNWQRLRAYWRFFCRMPYFDLFNLSREHSPFIWRRLHERAFRRYVGAARVKEAGTKPLYVAATRLRDRASVIFDARDRAHPLEVILATNYLPPLYTHAPVIDGERYGDGAFSDNAPYEALFERGCDAVVLIAQKGECEGGLFRNPDDPNHEIAPEHRDDVIVIRPRHPLPLAFLERRWKRLAPIADLGAARAREVLLGEPCTDASACDHGRAPSWYLMRLRQLLQPAGI